MQPVVYASSSLLPLTDGEVAFTERGLWRRVRVRNAPPIVPDGVHHVAAPGGGVWERDTVQGSPGATLVSSWRVNYLTGDDCAPYGRDVASLDEVLLRIGDQELDGSLTPEVKILVPHDSVAPKSIRLRGRNGANVILRGERRPICVPSAVIDSTQWGAFTEGVVTATGAASAAWTPADFVQVVGGSRNGSWFIVEKDLGGGQYRRTGGLDWAANGALCKPQLGDVVQAYEVTRWSSGFTPSHRPTITFDVSGNMQLQVWDLDIGPTGSYHEVRVSNTAMGLMFVGCRLHGLDVHSAPGFGVALDGCHVVRSHFYGGTVLKSVTGCLFHRVPGSSAMVTDGATVNLFGGNIFSGCGPQFHAGSSVNVSGPNAVTDYELGLELNGGACVDIDSSGSFWLRDAVGSTYGYMVNAGSEIRAQTTANLPDALGFIPGAGANAVFLGGGVRTRAQIQAITHTAPLDSNGASICVKV